MNISGIDTINRGTSNQLKGLIIQAQQDKNNLHNKFIPINELVWTGLNGEFFSARNFKDTQQFNTALSNRIDVFLQKNYHIPDIIALPFDQSLGIKENEDVDLLAELLKENFLKHNIKIKTLVIASNLYSYKNVDFIHIGAHQLSQEDEDRLQKDTALNKRIIRTLGVPSDLTKMQIKLATHKNEQLKNLIESYATTPTVVYSLGGKTADGIIKFTIDDAQNIMNSAYCFAEHGYKVIITNSPRTPNDVTDYLYQQCLDNPDLVFYNCKNVAKTEAEKQNFRFYTGPHEKEFSDFYDLYGNIYPAVLDICDFVVNSHDSFSYTSDVAALGIPSVVYTGNEIGEPRFDCHKLFKLCHEAGYTISLNEAVQTIKSGQKIKTKPLAKTSKQIIDTLKKIFV